VRREISLFFPTFSRAMAAFPFTCPCRALPTPRFILHTMFAPFFFPFFLLYPWPPCHSRHKLPMPTPISSTSPPCFFAAPDFFVCVHFSGLSRNPPSFLIPIRLFTPGSWPLSKALKCAAIPFFSFSSFRVLPFR